MKAVGFAGVAAILSIALAVGCGSDETDDGGRTDGPTSSGSGGEGGNGVGAGPTSSSGTPTSSSASSTGTGASGGENVGGSSQGGSGGDGGSAQGGSGGVGGDASGGAPVGGGGGAGGSPGGETCGNGTDDDANGNIDCADAACVGTAYCTLPAAWSCNAGFFNEGGDATPATYYCDCACDGHDPDCDLPPNANPLYCAGGVAEAGQTCVNDLCTAPTDWICATADYDEVGQGTAGPECDCACGVPDPDCDDDALPITGCPSGQGCTDAGECDPVPAAWTCDAPFYDEGGQGQTPICDCSCGAHDPDCDVVPAPTLYCNEVVAEAGQTCNATDVCTNPTAWTCMPAYYDEVANGVANPLCDCECGAVDPDCADDTLDVDGCLAGEVCGDDGTCELGVPAGWVCNPDYWSAADGCDCGCGVFDPDCANATVGACLYCQDVGSCGTGACPANIDPANNAICVP